MGVRKRDLAVGQLAPEDRGDGIGYDANMRESENRMWRDEVRMGGQTALLNVSGSNSTVLENLELQEEVKNSTLVPENE